MMFKLSETEGERMEKGDGDLPPAGPLPKRMQQPGLGQDESMCQEHGGGREPHTWITFGWFSGHVSRKLVQTQNNENAK